MSSNRGVDIAVIAWGLVAGVLNLLLFLVVLYFLSPRVPG